MTDIGERLWYRSGSRMWNMQSAEKRKRNLSYQRSKSPIDPVAQKNGLSMKGIPLARGSGMECTENGLGRNRCSRFEGRRKIVQTRVSQFYPA